MGFLKGCYGSSIGILMGFPLDSLGLPLVFLLDSYGISFQPFPCRFSFAKVYFFYDISMVLLLDFYGIPMRSP